MDRLAYTALNSINERRTSRHVLANELANVSTTGFKRSYEAAMQAVKTEGMGYDTRFSPQMEKIDRVFLTPGSLMVTGNATDITVLEEGVLGVQAPNGEVAFTRRGDLKTNVNGVLENGQGHLVLDEGGAPITVPPGFLVNITKQGGVFVRNPTEPAPQVEVPVAQLMLRDASETVLVRREDGLFEAFIDGLRQPGDFPTGPKAVEVVSGALEGSNVNPITAMVKLIDETRSFESSIRFIKSAKEIDESGAQLLRL